MSATVYWGPWQEWLAGMYDPERAIVITDPPFGIGKTGYTDDVALDDHFRQVLDGLPAARYIIRAPATHIATGTLPAPRRICVEVASMRKQYNQRQGAVPYQWHGWLVYGRLKIGQRDFRPRDWVEVDPWDRTHVPPQQWRKHDGITPWQAADWAIRTWAEKGWTILDPFAGTGTIGARAKALGFDYLGAEIDEHWARMAYARLEPDHLDLGLGA